MCSGGRDVCLFVILSILLSPCPETAEMLMRDLHREVNKIGV